MGCLVKSISKINFGLSHCAVMLPLIESSQSSLAISVSPPWSTVATEYSIPSEYAAQLTSFQVKI